MTKKVNQNQSEIEKPKGMVDVLNYFCNSVKIPVSSFELFILDRKELDKHLQTLKFYKFFLAPNLGDMYLGKEGAIVPEYIIINKRAVFMMKLARFLAHYHRELHYSLYSVGQFKMYLRKLSILEKELEGPQAVVEEKKVEAPKDETPTKSVTLELPESVKQLKQALDKKDKKSKSVKKDRI